MNWKRLLCLIGRHKPIIITELPVKAIVSGVPLSIAFDHPGGEMQVKGKVICLWCGRPLKGIILIVRRIM